MRTSTLALAIGTLFLALGVLGLIPAMLQPPPAGAPPISFGILYGFLFGLFPVNLLNSVLHLAVGLWGVAAWSGVTSALGYARSVALLYGLLAVMGTVSGLNTLYGVLPIHGHDIWLHATTALIAAYFGWRRGAVETERRDPGLDRRQRQTFVAMDRRGGLADRRRDYIAA